MKAVYKMIADCGRMGQLAGIFVAEKEFINFLIEHEIYIDFGEALGKHSEVIGCVSQEEIILLSDEPQAVECFEKYHFESGYNPLDYNVGVYDMEDWNEPENGIDWSDCTVAEYIDYKLNGVIPSCYKEEHAKWLKEQEAVS